MNSEKGAPAAPEAAAERPAISFDAAQQVVDVARYILSGDAAESAAAPPAGPAQATREPCGATVQNPAGE